MKRGYSLVELRSDRISEDRIIILNISEGIISDIN